MKYWGYLLAKLLAAGAFLWSVGFAIRRLTPRPPTFWNQRQDPFVHDLTYTTLMMLYFLLSIGLLYLVVWDQRYRCRTCVRKLRMPVAAGSWPNMFLIGQPRMEYICTYGHGTLKMPEVDLTGPKSPDWQSNRDMWKELESLEESKR